MTTPGPSSLFFFSACLVILSAPISGGGHDRSSAPSRNSPTKANSGPLQKRLSDSLSSRIHSRYEFKCPDQIHTGETHSIDFILRPNISASDISRLISEIANLSPKRPTAPCLIAELNFLDTNQGIVVKEITRPHQKLLAHTENHWNWQIKGLKPGQYLLSLTVSVCTDEASHHEPIATPVAINHKLNVIGPPVAEGSRTFLATSLIMAVGGALCYLLFKFLVRHSKDKKIKVNPPRSNAGRIFASYAKEDRDKVNRIVKELEAAGHSVWIDREGIEHATSWRAEIVEALSGSNCVVFFASPRSYESINVGREMELAHEENRLIIPVLLEDCVPSGASRFVVAGLQRIDARNESPKWVAGQIARTLIEFDQSRTNKTTPLSQAVTESVKTLE